MDRDPSAIEKADFATDEQYIPAEGSSGWMEEWALDAADSSDDDAPPHTLNVTKAAKKKRLLKMSSRGEPSKKRAKVDAKKEASRSSSSKSRPLMKFTKRSTRKIPKSSTK